MDIAPMSATAKKPVRSALATAKLEEQGRQIADLNRQVSHLTSAVEKLHRFIASADLVLGDYELTAGEILTLERRVKKDIANARKAGAIKPFDGTLKSLVAA